MSSRDEHRPAVLDLSAMSEALLTEIALALRGWERAHEDRASDAWINGRRLAPLPYGFREVRERFTRAVRSCPERPKSTDTDAFLEAVLVGPRLLTKAQAARVLSISERTLDRLVAKGQLAAVRIDRSVRFRVTDIDEYIANLLDTRTTGDAA